jgi:hypothetical protein
LLARRATVFDGSGATRADTWPVEMVPGDMLIIPVAAPSPLYPSTRTTGSSTTTRVSIEA